MVPRGVLFAGQLQGAEVLNAAEDASGVHLDDDQVEAGALLVFATCFAIVHGAAPHTLKLCIGDGFGGEAGSAAAGADFDEDQVFAVARDDVDLAGGYADVPGDDGHAGCFEALDSQALAEIANASAACYHGRESWATGA